MKGKVKIELRDKEGNLVHTQEKSNLVTNLIDDIFMPMAFSKKLMSCGFNDSNHITGNRYYTTRRLTLSMFDTIQLLGDELLEDPSDYMFGNQKVVGLSRYDLGYSNSNTLYGSFNGAESGWNEDKTEYTYVYDWTTAAANDVEIKSIALSPMWACQGGCGVDSIDTSVYNTDKIISPSYVFGNTIYDYSVKQYYMQVSDTGSYFTPLLFDYNDNSVLCLRASSYRKLTSSNPYLSISKAELPMSKYILGNRTRYTDGSELPRFSEDIATITIKNTLATSYSNNYGFIHYCDGKIYAMYSNSNTLAKDKQLIITILDLDTLEESYITFTNTTGKTLSFYHSNGGDYNSRHMGFIKNGNFYCVDTEGYLWSIDISTSESTQICYENGNAIKFSSYNYVNYALSLGDDILITCPSNYNYTSWCYLINTKTNVFRQVSSNTAYFTGASNTIMAPFKDNPLLIGGYMLYNGNIWYPWAYPLVSKAFSTKFNLEEPFTKNNEQSLKVIYILKFDE